MCWNDATMRARSNTVGNAPSTAQAMDNTASRMSSAVPPPVMAPLDTPRAAECSSAAGSRDHAAGSDPFAAMACSASTNAESDTRYG